MKKKSNSRQLNNSWALFGEKNLENYFSFDFIVEILLLVIIFLIPVIFDRRLGIVFSGTKVAWLRTLIVMILGVWALKLIVTREHKFVRTPLDWPILTFLLGTTVATLTSVHTYTSFVGFYGRFEGLSTWYLFGLLFFIATNYIHSREQLVRIVACVTSAAVLMSIYGVIQRHELDPYAWGGVVTWQRVIGTIGQPNFLAAYVIMAFFLGLILFLEKKEFPKEIDWFGQAVILGYFLLTQLVFVIMIYTLEANDVLVWYLGFALITAGAVLFAFNYYKLHPLVSDFLLGISLFLIYICLLYTQSRGGYMGFFTGAVLFVLGAGRNWIFENWKKLLALGFLILAISTFTMTRPEFSPFERFASEITTVKEKETEEKVESRLELRGAAGSRGETWKSSFKIISDNPLFGVGPEVLKMVFPRYETELFRFKEAFHVKQDRCHNETFDVPVTKGLLSFFAYLWILGITFSIGWKKMKGASDTDKLWLAGVLSAILAYLIQNQFSFGVVAITSLFWILWAMVMVLAGERKEEGKKAQFSWQEFPWIVGALIFLISVFLIYLSFISFRADIYYKTGKTYLEMRQLPRAEEELKKSLQIYPFEGTTISHLGITYLNMGNISEAIKYLNYGTQVDPFNADNFFMLGKVYLSFYDRGQKEALVDSLKYANIALKIDPYYAEAYELKGQISERQGNLNEAWNMYKKAYEVNPTLVSVMQKVEEISKKLGKTAEARKLLEEGLKKFPDNIDIFKTLERLP